MWSKCVSKLFMQITITLLICTLYSITFIPQHLQTHDSYLFPWWMMERFLECFAQALRNLICTLYSITFIPQHLQTHDSYLFPWWMMERFLECFAQALRNLIVFLVSSSFEVKGIQYTLYAILCPGWPSMGRRYSTNPWCQMKICHAE